MAIKKRSNRCKASAKTGKPCGAAATKGGLCFFHANPNRASELGRIGGRSKRPPTPETADPLPKLETVIAVRDFGARLIADVCAGRVQPRVAACLTPLLNLQMRAIETTDLEWRIERLEKLTSEAQSEGDSSLTQHPSPLGNLPSHFSAADSLKATPRVEEDPEVR